MELTSAAKLIKVAALTSGKNSPSGRFRIGQYIEPLKSYNVNVREYYPLVNKYTTKRLAPLGMFARLPGVLASRSSTVTWFERELLPERFSLERLTSSKRLLDVDDAIWLNSPHFSERLARFCDGVIAGNRFIAEHYAAVGARVWTIPTSLDMTRWRPAQSLTNSHWTIGWTGSSSNLKYLYHIEEPLADFLADHSEACLLVVCNQKPTLKRIPEKSWQFARWSSESEVSLVQKMNVGLMPLNNNEWSKGKCALKLIMYMAVGIPAIVSPVGVGGQLVQQHPIGLLAASGDEWYQSLNRLFTEHETARLMGAEGRRIAESQFSISRNVTRLAAVFHSLTSEEDLGS